MAQTFDATADFRRVTSADSGIAQWINLSHVIKILPGPRGGSIAIFIDGTSLEVQEVPNVATPVNHEITSDG